MLCSYGCGQEGEHQFKNGKWCCKKTQNKCPAVRRKNSESSKQNCGGWNKGLTRSNRVKNKISQSLKGRKISDETKKKMSLYHKGKILSDETKKKISLSRKGKYKGEENPNWKGGYFSDNVPLYDNFNNKLVEDVRRNEQNSKVLEVACSYNQCKKWFIPKLSDVYHRIEALNDINGMGESNLYCSDDCKNRCSIFGLNYDLFEKEEDYNINYTQIEYKQFRTYVLERDNYKCQYCGKQAEHVHHERPQKLEPFFALDPDLAWSVCKKCHYEKGHVDECSTGNLANRKCERK